MKSKKCLVLCALLALLFLTSACAKTPTPEESVKAVFLQANTDVKAYAEAPSTDEYAAAYSQLAASAEPQCIRDAQACSLTEEWVVAPCTMEVLTAADGMFHLYVPGSYAPTEEYILTQTYLVGDTAEAAVSLAQTVCGYSLTGQVKVVFRNGDGELRYVLYGQ